MVISTLFSFRGGLSLHVATEGAKASTRLSLLEVKPQDAGNYTCQPDGLESAKASVFVLQGIFQKNVSVDFSNKNIYTLIFKN